MSVATRGLFYELFYAVGVLCLIILSFCRAKDYNTRRIRAVIYALYTFLAGYFGARLIGVVFTLICYFTGISASVSVDVIGAVIFTAPLLLAAVYLEKAVMRRRAVKTTPKRNGVQPEEISFRNTMDLMIPGAFLVFACIKIGCCFRGCCFGVECDWGFEAQYLGSPRPTLFPVQAFESICIFIIAIASIFVQRAPFYRRGMSGPLAAFSYGAVRFFWEFFRWYPPELQHFFLGMTLWQAFCVLILIVAGIWIAILVKNQPCEPLPKQKATVSKTSAAKKKTAKNVKITGANRCKNRTARKRKNKK